MPLALAQLTDVPLAMGDYYPGDLLTSVLETDVSYWSSHPEDLLTFWNVKTVLEMLLETTDRLLADERWPPFG